MAGTEAQFIIGNPPANQILVINHTLTDASAAASYVEAIALPFDVVILSCYVTVTTTLTAAATNYAALSIHDGTQNILVTSTNSAGDNVTFTADTPSALLNYDGTHNLIAKAGVIQFRKTHAGTPANTMGQVEFTLIVATT